MSELSSGLGPRPRLEQVQCLQQQELKLSLSAVLMASVKITQCFLQLHIKGLFSRCPGQCIKGQLNQYNLQATEQQKTNLTFHQ